jgi:hypothetical protein
MHASQKGFNQHQPTQSSVMASHTSINSLRLEEEGPVKRIKTIFPFLLIKLLYSKMAPTLNPSFNSSNIL